MARIRTIKPEFFTSLTIASLPLEARLTFIGLWTHADDEGRCVDDTRLIRAAIWPLDDRSFADVEKDLQQLADASLILRYTTSGKRFLVIIGWREHQRINRPTKSKLPPPPDGTIQPSSWDDATLTEDAVSDHGESTDDSLEERKGTGKGKEKTYERSAGDRPTNLTLVEGGKGKTKAARIPKRNDYDDPNFGRLWDAYPRKVGKPSAWKAWLRAMTRGHDPNMIVAAASAYHEAVRGRPAEFIKHPGPWLNDERYNDQPVQPLAFAAGAWWDN